MKIKQKSFVLLLIKHRPLFGTSGRCLKIGFSPGSSFKFIHSCLLGLKLEFFGPMGFETVENPLIINSIIILL